MIFDNAVSVCKRDQRNNNLVNCETTLRGSTLLGLDSVLPVKGDYIEAVGCIICPHFGLACFRTHGHQETVYHWVSDITRASSLL